MVKLMLQTDYLELGEEKSRDMQATVVKVVSLLKNTLMPVNKESISQLVEDFNLDEDVDQDILTQMCARVMLKCQQVFGRNDTCTIDYDDMIWLPIVCKLDTYIMKFDFLFVDETQDLNKAQLELILIAKKTNGSIIAVGDPHQSIYRFRGADSRAMENIIERLNAKVLPLSICYRCPTSHVALAQKYVSSIEPSPYKGVGTIRNIKQDELFKNIQKGDLVLCRNSAPLVKPCFQLIRNGIQATIRGRDIGENLIAKVRKTKGTKMTEFLPNLKKDMQKEKANLESIGKSTESLIDRYETLLALAEDCDNTNCLIQKIQTIFSDKGSAVVFSTVHKAKGEESNSVYVLMPSLMPSPYAKSEEELKQEDNIIYISLTRSKDILTFIE
jgi:DNA helicase-2/ATP-dependent DNA helicase PcrA